VLDVRQRAERPGGLAARLAAVAPTTPAAVAVERRDAGAAVHARRDAADIRRRTGVTLTNHHHLQHHPRSQSTPTIQARFWLAQSHGDGSFTLALFRRRTDYSRGDIFRRRLPPATARLSVGARPMSTARPRQTDGTEKL